jgi:tetratricopeptide (TPR) repeat protein
MVGRIRRRQTWLVALALTLAWALPHAAGAQGANGKVEGVVKDAKGEPVEGATVVFQLASGRKIETRTNKQGQYSAGIAAGDYTISAGKGTLMSVPAATRVAPGATVGTNIVLMEKRDVEASAAAAAAAAKADATKVSEFKAAFDAGAAAASAGRHDEAIEKFTQAAGLTAKCSDCYSNIGNAYVQKKDYDKAGVAYLKSNEIKPSEASYTGLAQVYTAQKKLDQAAEAMKKAAELGAASGPAGGGGSADSLFNQGVILWNGGKIEEAKKQFQAAVAANPNHAEAHYQLGMALVNEGNLAGAASEWDTYLKLAPSGSHAAEVKAMLPSLK